MGGIIDTPLYTPKVIRLYEKQKQKSHNINMLWLFRKAI